MYAVEDNKECASNEAIAGFEPLTVRFVRISGVIAIVGCCLGF